MKVVNKPVEMIAWFSEQELIRPIKFRLKNEEGLNQIYKIDRIVTRKEEKLAGNRMLVFRCQSIINGREKVYELKYELATCRWFLFKI